MAKFHVNGKGESGECSATKGNCPFGSDSDHYTSAEAARTAFEKSNESFVAPGPLEKAREARRRALDAMDRAEKVMNRYAAYEGSSTLTKEGGVYHGAKAKFVASQNREKSLTEKITQLELESQEGKKSRDFRGKHRVPHDFEGYRSGYDGSPVYRLGGTDVTEMEEGFHLSYHNPKTMRSGGKTVDSFDQAMNYGRP